MKIDDNFWIEADSMRYTLRKEVITGEINPKTQKEIITSDQWYYPSIKDAIKGYVKHSLKDLPSDVDGVLQRLDEIEQKIDKL